MNNGRAALGVAVSVNDIRAVRHGSLLLLMVVVVVVADDKKMVQTVSVAAKEDLCVLDADCVATARKGSVSRSSAKRMVARRTS